MALYNDEGTQMLRQGLFDTMLESAQRGVALLDEKGPANWRDKIDDDRLDLGNADDDVFAQVYGEELPFDELQSELGISYADFERYGFNISWTLAAQHDSWRYYSALTHAWLIVLEG